MDVLQWSLYPLAPSVAQSARRPDPGGELPRHAIYQTQTEMAPQVQVLIRNVELLASSTISAKAKEVAIHDTDVSFSPETELSGGISGFGKAKTRDSEFLKTKTRGGHLLSFVI